MTLNGSQVLEQLQWRYAVKKFDAQKKLAAADWQALEKALVLTPSSYGLQPWAFVIVDDAQKRAELLPNSWNQKQVVECSQYVVFAIKEKLTEQDVAAFVDLTAQVQGIPRDKLAGYETMMINDVVKGPRSAWQNEWAARQAYIALGNLMTTAAVMGIDTCPMEGIDSAKYDEILGLAPLGLRTVVACAVGYRAADDKYTAAKKVRFPADKVVKHI